MASRRGGMWWRSEAKAEVCPSADSGSSSAPYTWSFAGAVLLWTTAISALMTLSWQMEAQTLPTSQAEPRGIAVTFDDLPAMSAMTMSASSITEMNRAILVELTAEKVPAIGFVNEISLYKTGEVDARIAVLRAWVNAGLDLGNHTYSHTSLNHAELRDWEDDVVQGESVTHILLTEHHKSIRYFRHPYLHAGPDLQTRREAEAFLTGRGYRVAPVTIDAFDWYFADLYDDARQRNDRPEQDRIVHAWLTYTEQVFAYSEKRSRALLGYEPKQVLLLHDTWLEADHLRELLALIRARGYRFLSLDDALKDAAYAQPDDYISDTGASWIEHWAVTRGQPASPSERPRLPDWIEKRHAALDAASEE